MNGLSISIPSKKNWFALIFGTAWIGGWFMGFSIAFTMLAGDIANIGANLFILFWLIGWTVGGGAVIFMLLWGYFGTENFSIDRGVARLEKTVFGFGIKQSMEVPHLKNFRLEVGNASWFGGNRWAFWGLGPGKVKFDYGLKTFSFGLALDDAEAAYLAELLNEKLGLNEK